MSIEVKVPQLPESVADATLVAWHKKPGDAGAARREPRRSRDRQGRARSAGAGRRACCKEIRVAGRRDRDERPGAGHPRGRRALRSGRRQPSRPAAPPAAPAAAGGRRASDEPATDGRWRREARVRRCAAWSRRTGSMPRRCRQRAATAASPRPMCVDCTARSRRRRRPPAAPRGRARHGGGRAEQRVPMTRLRARIAERLVQAQATQAMLTTFNEVDLHGGAGAARPLQGHASRRSTA